MERLSLHTQHLQLPSKISLKPYIVLTPEVQDALENNLPVVALESTIITHGMEYPINRDTALEVEDTVRKNGAIPATIAIIEGKIKIGLTPKDIEKLAKDGKTAKKCSRRDIPSVLMKKLNGSTTVAATMLLANMVGIQVFVTGGIGGVHRGVEETMDISADLVELGQTPVAVVCAGAKAILDIPKTIELLETLGVQVVGIRTNSFPEFYFTEGSCNVSIRIDTEKECANLIKTTFDELKMKNGILIAVPIPEEYAIKPDEFREVINHALLELKEKNIKGQDVTPFLLKRLHETTKGRSSSANVALIKNNACVGAKIALELSNLKKIANQIQSLNMEAKVVILGGVCIDVVGKSQNPFEPGTSNIGTLGISIGGVSRNITECLVKLGLNDTMLISIIGDDYNGRLALDDFEKKNMRKDGLTIEHGLTATYLSLLNNNGEMIGAVIDSKINDKFKKSKLKEYSNGIKNCEVLILDANLHEEVLKEAINIANSHNPKMKKIIYDPVSTSKCSKILKIGLIHQLYGIKPNVDELYTMCNYLCDQNKKPRFRNSQDLDDIKQAVVYLLKKAYTDESYLEFVLTSLGERGLLLGKKISREKYGVSFTLFNTEKITDIKSVNGAGDCFIGGWTYGLINNMKMEESIKIGLICSALSLKSHENIPPELTSQLILAKLRSNPA